MYDEELHRIKAAKTITCFEGCFAFNMAIEKLDVELVYSRSIQFFRKILNDIIKFDYNYISYDDIGRMHHIGRELGLLDWDIYSGDYEMLKDIWKKNFFPPIAKINPEKSSLLHERNQHFFDVDNHLISVIEMDDDNITFLEPLLQNTICIPKKEFKKCYDYTLYIFKKQIDESEKSKLKFRSYRDFVKHMKLLKCELLPQSDYLKQCCKGTHYYTQIRDACSVFNIAGQRAVEYFQFMDDIFKGANVKALKEIIEEEVQLVNKLRTLVEYCRLKKVENPLIEKSIKTIFELDALFFNEVISFREDKYEEFNK